MTIQAICWVAAAAALAAALAAGIADWRRSHRQDLDAAGWAPWRGLQVACLFAAMLMAALAMNL